LTEPGRATQVAVIGSGTCAQDSELAQLAEDVGRLIAEAEAVLICGGMTGVMEAASRGAAGAGGTVIGIVPTDSVGDANPHCTHVVATGIGHARNLAVVASGESVIAIGGEWGTLSEIGFARRLDRKVVTLRSWRAQGEGPMAEMPGVEAARSADEAVTVALAGLA
jgi:uncharacterized protein (TIGR00725 family)